MFLLTEILTPCRKQSSAMNHIDAHATRITLFVYSSRAKTRDSNINGSILRLSLSRIPITDEKRARLFLTPTPDRDDLLSRNPQETLKSV